MAGIELTTTVATAGPKILKRIDNSLEERVLKRGLRNATIVLERQVKKNLTYQRGSYATPAPRGRLGRRSGVLVNSVFRKIEIKQNVVLGRVGSDIEYARIHEKGGTIHGSPWLTIPLPPAMTRAGVVRAPARNFRDAFFIKSRAGNLLLVQKRKGGILPLFVLKKSIRIPARRPFSTSLRDATPVINQAFRQAAKDVVNKA